MRTFKLKIVSQTNTVIALLIFFAIIFLFIPIRNYLLPQKLGESFSVIATILSLLLLYFLFQKLARAFTEWAVSENGITIHWLTQFAFTKKSDYIINWIEIESCKKYWGPIYTTLKIHLKSGKTVTFYHNNSQVKDDFKSFIMAFESMYAKSCR
jgi:hypothetical protein